MQKLMHDVCLRIGNDRGTALVIAVVFSILLAIAGIGFLIVTTNSMNNDTASYDNDKAYYAAESGALLAGKWVMDNTSAIWPDSIPSTIAKSSFKRFYVRVTLWKDPTDANRAEVRSAVFTDSTSLDAAHFKKRVVLTLRKG